MIQAWNAFVEKQIFHSAIAGTVYFVDYKESSTSLHMSTL